MRIGGWQKVSLIDYPGMVSTVVFTVGCNFRCRYCHNAKLISKKCQAIDLAEWWGWLENRKGKLDAVVVSGGEPTLQTDLVEFILRIKKIGYKVKLDSNGTNPAMLAGLIALNLLDYIAMDIKAPWEKYRMVTGVDYDMKKIRQSADLIINSGIDHEFRTTYVEGLLKPDDLKLIIGQLKGARKYYLQNFVYSEDILDKSLVGHDGGRNIDLAGLLRTSGLEVFFR